MAADSQTGMNQTGKDRLTARAGLLSMGGLGSYVVYFFVPILLARLLDKDEYGGYGQFLIVAHLAYNLGIFGLPASITYMFPQVAEEQRASFLRNTVMAFLTMGALAGALSALLAEPLAAASGNPELAPLVRVGSLYILFLIASDFLLPTLVVLDRAGLAALCQVGETLLRVGAVLIPVALGFGVPGILLSLAGLLAGKLLLSLWYVQRRQPGGRPEWRLLARQARYSVPLGTAGGIGTLALNGIGFVALFFFNAAQFAVYTVGTFRVPLAILLKKGAKPVLREAFSRYSAEGRLDKILAAYQGATRKTALLVFPLAAFIAFHAEAIVVTLFSAKYLESVPIFRLASIAVLPGAIYYSVAAEGMGRSSLPLRLSIVQLFVGIPIAIAATATLGLVGPLVGEIAGTYAAGYVGIRQTMRLLDARFTDVLPVRDLSRILLVSTAAAACPLPLHLIDAAAFPRLLAAGAVFCALYLVGLVSRGGLLKPEDRGFLLSLGRRKPVAIGGAR